MWRSDDLVVKTGSRRPPEVYGFLLQIVHVVIIYHQTTPLNPPPPFQCVREIEREREREVECLVKQYTWG